MSQKSKSTFYCNLNNRNKYLAFFKGSRGGFPSNEGVLCCAKCTITTQGVILCGYLVLTKFRLSFLSIDTFGEIIPCSEDSVNFYDPRVDILLPQVRRVYLVKQDASAAAIPEDDQSEMERTVTPTKEMQKKLSLIWLPFPSSYNSPTMEFFYMQIECTDFNSICIVFDKKEPFAEFLNNFADLLRSESKFNYLFTASESYSCGYFESEESNINRFESLGDWDIYLSQHIDLSQSATNFYTFGAFVGFCIFKQINRDFSSNLSDREKEHFPRFSFHYSSNSTTRYIFRYCPNNLANSNISKKLLLPSNAKESNNLHRFIDIGQYMFFDPSNLSYSYELISEYVNFRTGRTRKFAKLSIKQFRTVFDQSGWLLAVSESLRSAAIVGSSVITSMETLLLVTDSLRNGQDTLILVSSLAQIMLLPQCRTRKGFIELIQKEWIADGFDFKAQLPKFTDAKPKFLKKFLEKNTEGSLNGKRVKDFFMNRASVISARPTEETSLYKRTKPPIFLLFLDCVFQLTHLYPTEFEFTSVFLCQIWNLLLTGAFTNFMDPRSSTKFEAASNLWLWIENFFEKYDAEAFKNPLYGFCLTTTGKIPHLPLESELYRTPNIEVWDDLFFQHHSDCSTVQVVENEKRESTLMRCNQFWIPAPNVVQRIKVIDAAAENYRCVNRFIDNVDRHWPVDSSDGLEDSYGSSHNAYKFERQSSRSMSFGFMQGGKQTFVKMTSSNDDLSFIGEDSDGEYDPITPSPANNRKNRALAIREQGAENGDLKPLDEYNFRKFSARLTAPYPVHKLVDASDEKDNEDISNDLGRPSSTKISLDVVTKF